MRRGSVALRVRPAIRRLAIVALIILTPLAAHALWDHVELRRLIREVERIQSTGEPVTLAEADGGYRPLSAEERRGASYMLAAAAIAFGHPWDPADLQPIREWIDGGTEVPARLDEIATRLHARAEREREAIRLADTAASLPFREFAPGTEHNYLAQSVAQASFAIAVRTVSLSLEDDGDAAVASALSALRFRRGTRSLPFNTGGHQVAVVLSLSSPSPSALLRLQEALELEDDEDRAVRDLLRTRASHLEPIWRRHYGADASAPRNYLPRGPLAAMPGLTRRLADTLHVWAEVIEAARTPWPGKRDAMDAVRQRHAGASWDPMRFPPPLHTVPLGATVPLSHLRQAVRPAELIEDRSARVAVAIERYRRDHGERLPSALPDLIPEYLPAIPADPFTGDPLLYRADPDAYVVYSVGDDLTDDGGRLLQPSPRGSASPYVSGPDLGVRILLGQRP